MTGSADPDDGIPDDVSLNSTLCSEADSEAQWNFERILAEAPNDDGVPWYLIQWTGYDKDEWSWEPRENIPVDGLEEWAETKAKQDRGEIEPFDIEKWLVEAASIKEAKASVKRERHRKRNFRRKREGLPMNLYDDEREQDYDVSDEDASNDDFNDILPPPKPPAGDASLPKKSPLKPQSLYADLKPKRKAPTDKPSNPSGSSSASKTATRREPAKQTTTGYQGTARKSSLTARPKPSHDVASTAARPIDTAAPPHSTDGPGTKRAKKSAGEKTTFRSATGNVFISGKKTQTRPKLADKIANPSKEARLFSNHSITRKVELKGREKADKAPSDIRQLGLFNISTGVATSASQTDSSSTAGPKKPPAQASPLKDARPPLEATKSSLKKSHSEAFPDPNEPLQEALRKKSRSVHFTGDTTTVEHSEPTSTPYPKDMPLVDEPEAMDTDDEELFVRGSSSQRLPRAPNAGANIAELRRMSLQDAFDRCKTQAVSKRVKLGSADSAEADVVFEDIPTTGESWVNQFIEEDPLVFDRIFTARGFSSQCQTQPGLSAGNLAQGSIRSDTQGASLEAAAESLRLGSFGVLYFHSDFCVIIYPSGCEDWMACVPENEPDNSAEVVLKYLVFRPNPSTAQPLTLTDGISHQTTLSNRVDMMRVMFGLEYKELLPTRLLKDQTGLSKEQGHHNFFLAFPPTADVMLNSIAAWLTEANPDCRLFSSQRGGDWHAFTSLGSQQCGTIIIHEDATPSVRLFAGLGHLLHQRNNVSFALWSLGVGTQVHPPFPSMDDQPSKPGHVTLTRLFPHGSAVLVTPSFLVAQPIQARRLLSWYSKRLAMPGAWNKLVVSASIVEFLQELSHEKAVQRQNFLSRNSRHFGPDLEVQAQQQGISHEDCIARLETLSMVTRLINSGKGNLADEVQEPFVYVDDCIDANDEQSLGNWFGFWSLTKLDCYRKFHILGSHENDYSRSLRTICIPRYASGTTADPDLALVKAKQAENDDTGPSRELDSSGARSQVLSRADGEEFTQYLTSDLFRHVGGFLKLYGYCVSWFNESLQMADHFGDPTCRFQTYRNWFSYVHRFTQPRGINTYAAIFYTIEGEWDSTAYPKGRFPKRHPWIGIWRPRNPHLSHWTATELLIWDVAAPQRFPGATEPHREGILPAQRALIDFVEQGSAEKNPGMPLQRVWLGGFDVPALNSTTVLDQTLEVLRMMLNNPKHWMPAPETALPLRGYRKVEARQERTAPDDTERHGGVVDERPEKIIFHPPRGNGSHEGIGRSKCGNVLFQEVSKIRLTDNQRTDMPFRFPPTMEWYMRQKTEDRHYEYINVDTWEGMFVSLSIPTDDGKKAPRRDNHGIESGTTSAHTTPRS